MFDTCTIATLEKLLGAKSFGGSIDHLTHCQAIFHVFSKYIRPPFCDLNYCPCIFGVLGTDHSYTCHLFPTRWSPYSFGYNSTFWNWHFHVRNGSMRCPSHVTLGCPLSGPTLWKPSGLVLSPIASFFGESPTRVGVWFVSNRHSFGYCASMFLLMCGFKGIRLVINSSYHTCKVYPWFTFLQHYVLVLACHIL